MASNKITGLRETLHALNKIKRNMYGFTVHAVDKYSDQLVIVARERCGKETEALADSIHKTKVRPMKAEIRGQVVAGHPAFIRGIGSYEEIKHGARAGKKATELATTQYAEAHDAYSGFMKNAADWGEAIGNKAVEQAIERAIRTF